MIKQNDWEKYYKNIPLNKIPWQLTESSYFTKLINKNKIKPCFALDLGCGIGAKSIYLAKKGFDVIGVDISKTAIRYAKENAKKAKVKINFITADATDLSFLRDKKFDFILDWANLHGIPKSKRKKYISEITKHTKKGSLLLLRCFAKDNIKKESVNRPMGKIFLFSKSEIEMLYKNFKIIETNKSRPTGNTPPSKWLSEYLMERR